MGKARSAGTCALSGKNSNKASSLFILLFHNSSFVLTEACHSLSSYLSYNFADNFSEQQREKLITLTSCVIAPLTCKLSQLRFTETSNSASSFHEPCCKIPEVAGGHFFPLRSCSKNFESGSGNFSIWESASCSNSGYHWSNQNLSMFLLKKWPRRLLPLPKLKSRSGSGFPQNFYSGSERKTQNPARVDSGTPDPWPPLQDSTPHRTSPIEK